MKDLLQVNSNGDYELAEDQVLTVSQIYIKLQKFFPELTKQGKWLFGNYKGRLFSIRIKNITYLGTPWENYKKRIQIPEDLSEFYHYSKINNMMPLLMGIYTYKDNTILCHFNIDDYIGKKFHNSSAHIWASDIQQATINDYFEKIDNRNCRITVFNENGFNDFLVNTIGEPTRKEIIKRCKQTLSQICADAKTKKYIFDKSIELNNFIKEEEKIRDFFERTDKRWYGKDCYKEMFERNFHTKGYPEWAGSYLEYLFEKYIKENNIEQLIRFAQEKKKTGIDLDLYFSQKECYGDLKAHSIDSPSVIGNDFGTIISILQKEIPFNHIYYLICEHQTEKDFLYDFEVLNYWMKLQKKSETNYHNKMKNNITLNKALILEINPINCDFLQVFIQGKNSNGRPRDPKISIDESDFEEFIIEEINL